MTEPDTNLFARYIPGFEFLQNLTRQAAGGSAPGASSSVPGMPPLSHWVAPTFDVEELDKRIQDLKAVHFWLDQNTKALAATIQALEVQKMTLATLKSMNVSMQDMAEAFKIRPDSGPAPAPAPDSSAAAQSADAAPPSPPVVDPMQWWSALTQQFQTIATGAMQEMAQQVQAGAEAVAAAQSAPMPSKPSRKAAPKTRQSGQKAAKPAAKSAESKTPKPSGSAKASSRAPSASRSR